MMRQACVDENKAQASSTKKCSLFAQQQRRYSSHNTRRKVHKNHRRKGVSKILLAVWKIKQLIYISLLRIHRADRTVSDMNLARDTRYRKPPDDSRTR